MEKRMRVLTLIGAAVVALAALTTFATAGGSPGGVTATGGKAGGVVMRSGVVTATGQYDDLQRWVNIVNAGSSELVDVYISDVGTDFFGNDLFDGQFHLAGGEWTQIEPYLDRGYCMYDAKFVFADGTEQFLWNFNLCETLDITISEYGVEDMTFVG
jgi:hypothetical protein